VVRFAWLSLALLLTGCPYVGEGTFEQVRDRDGDGEWSDRFGGDDCRDEDPEIVRCDADGDGQQTVRVGGEDCDDTRADVYLGADEVCDEVDNDCDGAIDARDDGLVGGVTYYADADGDQFGDPDTPGKHCEASPPAGWTEASQATDCDDGSPAINVTADERCDAIDHNCDGDPTAGAVDHVSPRYLDADGDHVGTGPDLGLGCLADLARIDGDCDDGDASVFPGAVEIPYDNVDGACDGPEGEWDVDGDGFEKRPPDNDCDDDNAAIHPEAEEVCDGVDDDCNGQIDDADPDRVLRENDPVYFVDADSDGFGSERRQACIVPQDAVLVGGDCDDAFATVFPGATEACDGVDNDCDGTIDLLAADADTYYVYSDGDGFGAPSLPVKACAQTEGIVANAQDCNDADAGIHPGAPEVCGDGIAQACGTDPWDCDRDGARDEADGGTDCDDADPEVNPGASEVCDGIDNDCNDMTDSADPGVDPLSYTDWFLDEDGDGFGSLVPVAQDTCDPPPNTANNDDDCDDEEPLVFPGAPEVCNDVDDDCDDLVDTGALLEPPTFYFDGDGDGFGDSAVTSTVGCDPPGAAWVATPGDCDDTADIVHPGAPELCDGYDDDCDGLLGDDDPDQVGLAWYRDDDEDSYGQDAAILFKCAQPEGYVLTGGDCDDADETVQLTRTWYADTDQDGFGDPEEPIPACVAPVNAVLNDLDCDDGDPTRSPQGIERCDQVDNDCDDLVDDADPSVIGQSTWYADVDEDGWGANANQVRACSLPEGHVSTAGDCDDGEVTVYLGAPELCDTLDNDCDNLVDVADPDYAGNTTWYSDGDEDGHGDPSTAVTACQAPPDTVALGDDCDDEREDVHPGMTVEICDGFDNDCDGFEDYFDPNTPVVDTGGSCDRPPTVWAGSGQTVLEETPVALDGLAYDEEPASMTVVWTQLVGTPVTLTGADTLTATFTAPPVDSHLTLVFALTATDGGGLSTTETVAVDVLPVNAPPQVYAGPDLLVTPGAPVTLAGVATDADGSVIATTWRRLSGPLIVFDDAGSLNASFTAPTGTDTQVLLLELEAVDDLGASTTDTLIVIVDPGNPDNPPPIASAGPDDSVTSGSTTTLQGSASDDSRVVSTTWTQLGGPPVTLVHPATLTPHFVAPLVLATTPAVFQLVVIDDEGAAGMDQVVIHIEPPLGNLPPIVDAGPAVVVRMGTGAALAGSASDLDGTLQSVAWTQTAGPTVTLTGADTLAPTFTAPSDSAWHCGTTLRFQLVATDDEDATASDEVPVFVLTAPPGYGAPVSSPYVMDFEGDDGGAWTTDTVWEWGIPSGSGPGAATSGARLWGTVLGGDYYSAEESETSLCLPPVLLPAGAEGTFATRLYSKVKDNRTQPSGTQLQYLDPQIGWLTIEGEPAYDEEGWASAGIIPSWLDAMVPLPAGAADNPVVLRLRMLTEQTSTQPGTYVDDLIVAAESQDTDGDGIAGIFDERDTYGTSPWEIDTDGDGALDKAEVEAGTSPTFALDYPGNTWTWTVGDGTDLEADDGGLYPEGTFWEWGVPTSKTPYRAESGTKVWGTNLDGGTYGGDEGLVLPVLDLDGVPDAVLTFRLHASGAQLSGLSIERWDDVAGWQYLAPEFPERDGVLNGGEPVYSIQGERVLYDLVAVDLSDWANTRQILRLHWYTSGTSFAFGAYVDDLRVDAEGDDPDADGITGILNEVQAEGTDPFREDTDGDGSLDPEGPTHPRDPADHPGATPWSLGHYDGLDGTTDLVAGDDVWEFGVVYDRAGSGHTDAWSWVTRLGEHYPDYSHGALYLPPLDLTDGGGAPAVYPTLTFWMLGYTGNHAGVNLEVWDGSDWVVAPPLVEAQTATDALGRPAWGTLGTGDAYYFIGADLSEWTGEIALARFAWEAQSSNAFEGMFIDDLLLCDEVTDCDGDGLLGAAEEYLDHGTNPAVADTDGDGVDDGTEVGNGTDPLDPASY